MGTSGQLQTRIRDENAILRHILEGTATVTGSHFFKALVAHLAIIVQTHSAWVTEYIPETRQLHVLVFCSNGQVAEDFYIDIDGTACEQVIDTTEIVHYPGNVRRLYPHNSTFKEFEGTLGSRVGRRIPVRIHGDGLQDDHGGTIGYMQFVSDLTRQKRSRVLAGEVQKSLQPQNSPAVKGFDIAGQPGAVTKPEGTISISGSIPAGPTSVYASWWGTFPDTVRRPPC